MPSEGRRVLSVQIKIKGNDVPEKFMQDIRSLDVEQTLHLPSMFTIDLNDAELEFVDSEELSIGNEVEILLSPTTQEERDRPTSILKGEITSIEPWFSAEGDTRIVIRGYDKSHRLSRGTVTKNWSEVKDSDLASELAGEADMSANVDTTNTVYKHVWQYNQSNWEFLMERAKRIGYWLYTKENQLYFKKTPPDEGTVELKLGEGLLNFNGRMSVTGKSNRTKVRGWDPGKQEVVLGEAQKPASIWIKHGGVTESGGDLAKEAFGEAEYVTVDRPVVSQTEAQVMAEGIINESEQNFIHGEGTCDGNPDIRPGAIVNMEGLGNKWHGEYRVTRASHRIETTGRYITEFTVSSRHFTLSDLIEPVFQNGNSITGPVIAKVTNIDDEEGLGRIKLKLPWLANDLESDWARVVTPGAGPERGFYCLPEVDDEVMVVFEHGNVNSPFVIGGLWSKTNKPPSDGSSGWIEGGELKRRGLVTTAGWKLELDDTGGSECLTITSPDEKTSLILDQGKKKVVIGSDDKVSIEAKGDVIVESKSGGINVKGSSGKLNFEGNEIVLKSMGNVTIEGLGNVNVKATGQMKVEGTGPTTVSSSAITEIKGSLVRIN